MFNSFLSKFKSLISGENTTSPTLTPSDSAPSSDSSHNRVVFSPAKSDKVAKVEKNKKNIPQAQVAPNPQLEIQAQAQAKAIVDNARRIETEAKNKEAEIFQRLKSLDDK